MKDQSGFIHVPVLHSVCVDLFSCMSNLAYLLTVTYLITWLLIDRHLDVSRQVHSYLSEFNLTGMKR